MIVRKVSGRWLVFNDKNAVVATCKTKKEAEEVAWKNENGTWREVSA